MRFTRLKDPRVKHTWRANFMINISVNYTYFVDLFLTFCHKYCNIWKNTSSPVIHYGVRSLYTRYKALSCVLWMEFPYNVLHVWSPVSTTTLNCFGLLPIDGRISDHNKSFRRHVCKVVNHSIVESWRPFVFPLYLKALRHKKWSMQSIDHEMNTRKLLMIYTCNKRTWIKLLFYYWFPMSDLQSFQRVNRLNVLNFLKSILLMQQILVDQQLKYDLS